MRGARTARERDRIEKCMIVDGTKWRVSEYVIRWCNYMCEIAWSFDSSALFG